VNFSVIILKTFCH